MLGEQIQQNRLLLRKSNQSWKVPTKTAQIAYLIQYFHFSWTKLR